MKKNIHNSRAFYFNKAQTKNRCGSVTEQYSVYWYKALISHNGTPQQSKRNFSQKRYPESLTSKGLKASYWIYLSNNKNFCLKHEKIVRKNNFFENFQKFLLNALSEGAFKYNEWKFWNTLVAWTCCMKLLLWFSKTLTKTVIQNFFLLCLSFFNLLRRRILNLSSISRLEVLQISFQFLNATKMSSILPQF